MAKIFIKGGSTASWNDNNKDNTLDQGELGAEFVDSDTVYLKVGNGESGNPKRWPDIPYIMDHKLSNILADNAGAHNCICRGKDLTNLYSIDEICSRISAGTFKDLYVGDYFDITMSSTYGTETVRCVIACLDYYYGRNIGGDTLPHHAIIVPRNGFTSTAAMNTSATTAGGYQGSHMYNTVLPEYQTALEQIFSSHMLQWTQAVTNGVDDSLASDGFGDNGVAYSSKTAYFKLSLMTETMVYGNKIRSSGVGDLGGRYINTQFSIFRLAPHLIRIKAGGVDEPEGSTSGYWLQSVAFTNYFLRASGAGDVWRDPADSLLNCVRPYWIIG